MATKYSLPSQGSRPRGPFPITSVVFSQSAEDPAIVPSEAISPSTKTRVRPVRSRVKAKCVSAGRALASGVRIGRACPVPVLLVRKRASKRSLTWASAKLCWLVVLDIMTMPALVASSWAAGSIQASTVSSPETRTESAIFATRSSERSLVGWSIASPPSASLTASGSSSFASAASRKPERSGTSASLRDRRS